MTIIVIMAILVIVAILTLMFVENDRTGSIIVSLIITALSILFIFMALNWFKQGMQAIDLESTETTTVWSAKK